MAKPVKGKDGRIYYPVVYDKNSRAKILGLPKGEDPNDYVIEEATLELLKSGSGKYVAVKADAGVIKDRDDWYDRGGEVKY